MNWFKKKSLDELRAETRDLEMAKARKLEYKAAVRERDELRSEVSGRKELREKAGKVADKLAAVGRQVFADTPKGGKRTSNPFAVSSPLLDGLDAPKEAPKRRPRVEVIREIRYRR